MESVYDTEFVEVLEEISEENNLQDTVEINSGSGIVQETSSETIVYYVTPVATEDSNQSADIVTCLVVIILLIGISCGVMLGRILWGRIK